MKKSCLAVSVLVALSLVAGVGSAGALEGFPTEPGFSGFVRPGGGYLDIESNMVAKFGSTDLSADPIGSTAESNDGESSGIFMAPFNVAYTFENLKTQVFLGTQLTDLARFDFTQQLGIKQKGDRYGILQAGLIFSAIVTEVWEDPYVTNQKRTETDRDITGAQLVWDKIYGSDLELTYRFRSIDIDDEKSGQFLGLTAAQQALLARDGDQHSIEALYLIKMKEGHLLAPSIKYQLDDRDGDARNNDAIAFKLTYSYLGDPLTVFVNGSVGQADYDEVNPIYGVKQEDDLYGAGLTIFYTNPWGWQLWDSKPVRFYVEGVFAERDADIDFYDEKVVNATAGVMLRW